MELMLAVTLLAILMSAAVPAFTTFIQNNRVTGQANEIVSAFQYARSEALQRGVPVQVCASGDQDSCGGAWGGGWIVREPGGDGPLRVWASPGDDFTFDAADTTFVFDQRGFVDAGGTIELTLDNTSIDGTRCIEVSNSGSVSAQRSEC